MHQEIYQGFTLKVNAHDDVAEPDWQMVEGERDVFWEMVRTSEMLWLCVSITASLEEIDLAVIFQGACMTTSHTEFLDSRVYTDLRKTVVQKAKLKIHQLYQRLGEGNA